MNIIILPLTAVIVSLLSMPIIITISHKYELFDSLSSRKIHIGNISRFGGLGIFLAVFPLTVYVLYRNPSDYKIQYIIISMLLAFLCGFTDDVVRIKGVYKLLIQIVAASVFTASGLLFHELRFYTLIHINFGIFAYPITVFWIIAFMNAVNLIDGMDGLSSGIVLIANIFVIIISYMQMNYLVLTIAVLLECSILGFYIFNFPPAKIFLGDGGAYFIGFMYAIYPLMGIKKSAALTVFLVPMILMLVPISDVAAVIYKRFKSGNSLFQPDKNHLHHRLMNLGFSTKGILMLVYSYTLILGIFSLVMVASKPELTMILFGFIVAMLILSMYILRHTEKMFEIIKDKEKNESEKIRNISKKSNVVRLKNKIR